MPNLSLTSGLNLVNASANNICTATTTLVHDGNHLNALATLQATSNNTLTLPSTAQLVPMTALSNIQLQQMQSQSYIDQANLRNASQHHSSKASNQFLHVQIANPLPTMVQANIVQVSQDQVHILDSGSNVIDITTGKKSSTSTESQKSDIQSESGEASSTQKKSTNQNNGTIKNDRSGDSSMNDLSNKYLILNSGKGFRYRCLVCSREFTQKGNLKTHAITHLGPTERPYDCETCGKRFTQKGNRDIHVKIHTGTKDHTCPYCDRGFTQRGNLKTHIRSVHTGEKPFSCGHCGKTFSQKANMLTHYRTHDKNSRFSCNVCGKTFSQKGNLKTHQQRHVQETGM